MTALTAAAARAAHLVVDQEPWIFDDSLAAAVLGDQAGPLLEYHRQHGRHEILAGARVMVTTRSRYTEDRLADAAVRRITQYVLLGAGLDTFAWRSPLAAYRRTGTRGVQPAQVLMLLASSARRNFPVGCRTSRR